LIERRSLVQRLAPPLDHLLVTQLLDEFVSMERRYIQRDWEPAELDGGQFCEALARILYQADAGHVNHNKTVDECLKYVENEQVTHGIYPRRDALHMARVVRTAYTFRSQRGAVHISATYSPNHMDSRFLIEAVRWSMAEVIRIWWTGDRDLAAKAIRELLQFDVPCIGSFEGALLVQRTDLKAEEEILVLLHYAGERGFGRKDILRYAQVSERSVDRALECLTAPDSRQVIRLDSGDFRLTDLGSKRIREHLAEKLLLA
jgi:hypothetical protein